MKLGGYRGSGQYDLPELDSGALVREFGYIGNPGQYGLLKLDPGVLGGDSVDSCHPLGLFVEGILVWG
jgi:hypothetical protein